MKISSKKSTPHKKYRQYVVILLVSVVMSFAGLITMLQSNANVPAPSITSKGSFTKRACTRSYDLTGMQIGVAGDPNANGNRLRTVITSAQQGDCIRVNPGHYRLAGNIDFTIPNITLQGMGDNRKAVWFEHTTETRALFMVKAGGVHFYNFTHRVLGSARSSLGQSGEGNIWAQGGHSGFRMEDVLAWGSRDAAIFLYGIHNFELNRVESRDSKSDAYHVSNGSSYGKFFDGVSRNSGDDGIGFVTYGDVNAVNNMSVVRHHVAGQSWGRGFGLIHVNNINFYGPTLIEDSAGAAVIIAREPQYAGGGIAGAVTDINFYGELRLRRSNSNSSIAHGAIVINNPNTDRSIERVKFQGPVVVVDTRTSAPGQVRAYGTGKILAEIADVRFYGTGPSSKLSLSLSSDSSVTALGWSQSTPYLSPEPAFPLGGTVSDPVQPPPATTAQLAITSPTPNQTVGKIIEFSGTHTGMKNVEIFHGGAKVGSGAISGTNWAASISTASVAEGSQTYTVHAWDSPLGQPYTQQLTKTVTVNVATAGNGDANGDGRVNAIDLSIIISKDGQNFPAADFNNDGTVGASDMAIVLSKWTW